MVEVVVVCGAIGVGGGDLYADFLSDFYGFVQGAKPIGFSVGFEFYYDCDRVAIDAGIE